MKKLFIFPFALFLSLFLCSLVVSAQIVYTPKSTAVSCTSHTEWSQAALRNQTYNDSMSIITHGYNAKIIGPSSNLYNCHFYAWHLSENSGTPYWLDPSSELLKYLEPARGGDGSYMPATYFQGIADKILIGTFRSNNSGVDGDHSMDFSPDPQNQGKDWVSKWGPGPLVQHGKYDHIYSKVSSNYHEYCYNVNNMINWKNPYIDVPSLICTKTRQTYNIVVDSHFRIGSITISNEALFDNPDQSIANKTVTLQPKTNAFGTCKISCTIRNGCGAELQIEKIVSIGMNPAVQILGPSCMCAGQSYYIYTRETNDEYTFNWQFQYGTVTNAYRGCIEVTPYLNQGYVTLTTTNACGVISTQNVLYPSCGSSCSGYYMVYPNPATTSIQIETTKEALEAIGSAKIQKEKLSDKSGFKLSIPELSGFDYVLYSKEGNVRLSGKAKEGKVKISVDALPRGIYFLEINNGLSPETHQLLLN